MNKQQNELLQRAINAMTELEGTRYIVCPEDYPPSEWKQTCKRNWTLCIGRAGYHLYDNEIKIIMTEFTCKKCESTMTELGQEYVCDNDKNTTEFVTYNRLLSKLFIETSNLEGVDAIAKQAMYDTIDDLRELFYTAVELKK